MNKRSNSVLSNTSKASPIVERIGLPSTLKLVFSKTPMCKKAGQGIDSNNE